MSQISFGILVTIFIIIISEFRVIECRPHALHRIKRCLGGAGVFYMPSTRVIIVPVVYRPVRANNNKKTQARALIRNLVGNVKNLTVDALQAATGVAANLRDGAIELLDTLESRLNLVNAALTAFPYLAPFIPQLRDNPWLLSLTTTGADLLGRVISVSQYGISGARSILQLFG